MTSLTLESPAVSISLHAALDEAERIAAKDRSSLYRVSQYFEDAQRYDAFIAMYAVMRVVDDLVDNAGDKAALPAEERQALHTAIDTWEQRIRRAYSGRPAAHPLEIALAWAVDRFPVPERLWQSFLNAMRYDIDVPRFRDFQCFLEYTEGASVAPTTLFVHLICAERQPDGRYRLNDFDYLECGRQLGTFAYIAHILRDVRPDMESSPQGLIYISQSDLRGQGLDEEALRRFTKVGAGGSPFARLVESLVRRARGYEALGTRLAATVWGRLPADRAFIFRLIVGTYSALLDGIATHPGVVLTTRPVLSATELALLAERTARESGFPLNRIATTQPGRRTTQEQPALPPSARLSRTDRWREITWTVGGALVATSAICAGHSRPWILFGALALELIVLARRGWGRRDAIRMTVGGVTGVITEAASEATGLWTHPHPQWFGMFPAYLLVCYLMLGFTVPRLVKALAGAERSSDEGSRLDLLGSATVWVLVTVSCALAAGSNGLLLGACGLSLALFLACFRSLHDGITVGLGVLLGLVWEIPCTLTGAWRFPQPELFGLIPFWLPLAYATYFGAVGRMSWAAVQWVESRKA